MCSDSRVASQVASQVLDTFKSGECTVQHPRWQQTEGGWWMVDGEWRSLADTNIIHISAASVLAMACHSTEPRLD